MFTIPQDDQTALDMQAPQPTGEDTSFWTGVGGGFTAERIEIDSYGYTASTRREVQDELSSRVEEKIGADALNAAIAEAEAREAGPERPVGPGPTAPPVRLRVIREIAEREGVDGFTTEAIEAETRRRVQAEHADAMEAMAWMGGPRIVGEILGRGGAAVTDPTSLALIPFGGGGSIARIVAREAFLGATAEALVLPQRFKMAKYLDRPDPNVALHIGLGAVAGGVIGGGMAAGARGIAYATRRSRAVPADAEGGDDAARAAVDAVEDALANDLPIPPMSSPFDEIRATDAPEAAPAGYGPPREDVDPQAPPPRDPDDPGPMPETSGLDPVEVGLRAALRKAQDEGGADNQRPLARWLRGRAASKNDPGEPGLRINPDGRVGQELRTRGITSKTHPGLLSRQGAMDLDNIPASEFADRFPQAAGRIADDGRYVDPDDLTEALIDELNGAPRFTGNPALAEANVRLDDYLKGREALNRPVDRIGESDDPFHHVDGYKRVEDEVTEVLNRSGLRDAVTGDDKRQVIDWLARDGGTVQDALDELDRRDLAFAMRGMPDEPEDFFDQFPPRTADDLADANARADGAEGAGRSDADGRATSRGEEGADAPGGTSDVASIPTTELPRKDSPLGDPTSAEAAEVHEELAVELRTWAKGDDTPILIDGQTTTAREMLESLDRDQDFLEALNLCGRRPA